MRIRNLQKRAAKAWQLVIDRMVDEGDGLVSVKDLAMRSSDPWSFNTELENFARQNSCEAGVYAHAGAIFNDGLFIVNLLNEHRWAEKAVLIKMIMESLDRNPREDMYISTCLYGPYKSVWIATEGNTESIAEQLSVEELSKIVRSL